MRIGAFVMLLALPLFAASDQLTTEHALSENKAMIEFMDVCVTNFGDKEKEQFFDVYQLHFNGELAFLQSEYSRASKNVYQSQKRDTTLSAEMLTKYYMEHSKDILDRLAPGIIKSKNQRARLYLTLAYRDRSSARSMQTVADASTPRMYSYRINRYHEAIKLARRSMRYGFLGLFEAQDIETKKYIYNHMLEIEREKDNFFYNRFLSKTGQAFTDELNADFEKWDALEVQRLQEAERKKNQPAPAAGSAPLPQTAAPAVPAASVPAANQDGASSAPAIVISEQKVERSLRFRSEKRVAEFLMNGEFDRAEEILRKYVPDYDYKKISAMIEVLEARQKNDQSAAQIDYALLKLHHNDNYARLSKKSALEEFSLRVKVVDVVKKPDAAARDQNQTAPAGAAQPAVAPAAAGAQGSTPPAGTQGTTAAPAVPATQGKAPAGQ